MKNNKLKKILLRILKLLYYIVIGFVCLIAGILIYYIISVQIHSKDENYVPGISIYTIVSPSMTPNVNVYDVVVNVRVSNPEDIEIGDIITFKSQAATSDGMTITHRVIAIDRLPDGTYEYMTQGDNNHEPDSSYVTYENIIGKEIITIPALGKVQFLIANKKSWLFLLLIPISIYLIKEIYKLVDLLGLKKKVNKVLEREESDNLINKEKQEKLKQQLKKDLEKYEKQEELLAIGNDSVLNNYSATTIKTNEQLDQNLQNTGDKVISPSKPINEESPKVKENTGRIELPKIKEYESLDNSRLNIKDKDYLEGSKIKVVSVEETKNKKKNNLSTSSKDSEDDGKINLSKDITIPRKNPHMKVERPESEDIKELRKKELNNNTKESKKNLNLNPNKPKKINRNKNKNKQLNLNPSKVKKVNRYQHQNKKANNNKKKKQPLIIIEKIK